MKQCTKYLNSDIFLHPISLSYEDDRYHTIKLYDLKHLKDRPLAKKSSRELLIKHYRNSISKILQNCQNWTQLVNYYSILFSMALYVWHNFRRHKFESCAVYSHFFIFVAMADVFLVSIFCTTKPI